MTTSSLNNSFGERSVRSDDDCIRSKFLKPLSLCQRRRSSQDSSSGSRSKLNHVDPETAPRSRYENALADPYPADVPQGVKPGTNSAGSNRRLGIGDAVGDPRGSADRDHYLLSISTVGFMTKEPPASAERFAPAAAKFTHPANGAPLCRRYSIARRKVLNHRSDFGDHSSDFVPGDSRQFHAPAHGALAREHVVKAHSASTNFHEYLSWSWRRGDNLPFLQHLRTTEAIDHNCLHPTLPFSRPAFKVFLIDMGPTRRLSSHTRGA